MRNKLIYICILIFSTAFCQAENILLLTDIHFNPYFNCAKQSQNVPCHSLENLIENPVESWPVLFAQESINGFKQETNNAFLTQGINNLVMIAKKDKVRTILITGDILEHNFNTYYTSLAPSKYNKQQDLTSFTYKTIIYVLQTIHTRLPDVKIYLVFGNNDSDYSDYQLPSENLRESIAGYLSSFIDKNKKDFIASFSQGGYFSTSLTDNVTLIGINSNILSSIHSDPELAAQQLYWLKQQLSEASKLGKKVIILQHIPYGADLYKSSINDNFIPLFDLDLQAAYLNTLNQYSSTITTLYTGHYHAELLSIINSKTPVIGSIAFNTMFGNNPGFKIAEIDSYGNFAGYTTYYSDLANGQIKWLPLYNFEQVYGQPKKIISILNQFPFSYDESKVINYRKYFNGNNPEYAQPISSDKNWKFYYCGIKYIQPKEYLTCIKSTEAP